MLQHKNFFNFCSGLILLAAALSFGACKLEDLEDPNNPNLEPIEANATIGEIQNVADGIQAGMRINMPIYVDDVSVIGREFWRFSGSDPRYYQDLLGAGEATLDPGSFYTTNAYGSRYRVVRNTIILDNAVANTTDPAMTPTLRAASNGFSKTIRAHELLLALTLQWDNGIRVDLADPDRLGPFLSDAQASLDAIAALLDEANADLAAGAPAFPFQLRSGFSGFDSTATFAKFNRALAARVDAYRGDWAGVLDALNGSFLDLNGDLNAGVFRVYSISGGDQTNDVYQSPTAKGEVRIVHPSFIADIEANDDRIDKVLLRSAVVTQPGSGLSGQYAFNLYKSNTDPMAIIRNEELILLFAEANIQMGGAGLVAGKTTLDALRASHGLLPSAALTQPELIDEMLEQRRFSLYGEGHRWVDMRRYGRLDQLPLDRPDDNVWDRFPRPAND